MLLCIAQKTLLSTDDMGKNLYRRDALTWLMINQYPKWGSSPIKSVERWFEFKKWRWNVEVFYTWVGPETPN